MGCSSLASTSLVSLFLPCYLHCWDIWPPWLSSSTCSNKFLYHVLSCMYICLHFHLSSVLSLCFGLVGCVGLFHPDCLLIGNTCAPLYLTCLSSPVQCQDVWLTDWRLPVYFSVSLWIGAKGIGCWTESLQCVCVHMDLLTWCVVIFSVLIDHLAISPLLTYYTAVFSELTCRAIISSSHLLFLWWCHCHLRSYLRCLHFFGSRSCDMFYIMLH